MNYRDASKPVSERIEDLLARMTLPEKIAQLGSVWVYDLQDSLAFSPTKVHERLKDGMGQITRIGGGSILNPQQSAEMANAIQAYLIQHTRLGIPGLVHEECCSGLMALGATAFPQMIGLASTWMPGLAEQMTDVIRKQMRAAGSHEGLSPILDVTREPRWGRIEETFGEDPFLIAQFGMAYVRGLQGENLSEGVMATAKHFLGHGISEGGLNCSPVHIGPRELRNVFTYPFEAVIRESKLAAIMNAYSDLDGVVVAASKAILTGLLRDELGFTGLVVSDYQAIQMIHSYHFAAPDLLEAACRALEAGIDVELPNTQGYSEQLCQALESGRLQIETIDRAVRRHLQKKFELGLFERPFVDSGRVREVYDTADQRAVAHEIAAKSLVLLKNEGHLLPLKKDIRCLAVIGPNADRARHLLGDYSHPAHIENLLFREPQLADSLGQGVEPGFVSGSIAIGSLLDAVRQNVSADTRVLFERGCEVDGEDCSGFEAALAAAREADIVLLALGDKSGLTLDCTCGEARDRASLGLPGVQQELAQMVLQAGKPTVLVLINGRPLAIPELVEQTPAILEAWLPGEEGGLAIAEALFGDINPGGKLPVSFPRSVGQLPVYYNHQPSGARSQWHGDYADETVRPLFPFGHGLSYTCFGYQNLRIEPQTAAAGESVSVSLEVENVGNVQGEEVVQLYTRDRVASTPRPVQELKGFARLPLEPGEKRRLVFHLPVDLLAFYNEELNLVVEAGTIEVMLGSSADDIRLRGAFEIAGEAEQRIAKRAFTCPVEILG